MTSLLNIFATLAIKVEIKAVSDGINEFKSEISGLREEFVTFEPRLKAAVDRLDAIEVKLSILQNNGSPGNNPEDILRELNDRVDRARDLVIYNLPDYPGAMVGARVAHDIELIVKLIQAVVPSQIQQDDIKLVRIGKPNRN